MQETSPVSSITSGTSTVAAVSPTPLSPGYNVQGTDDARWSIAWPPLLLLCALGVLLYHGIAVKLVRDWSDLPDFSHGFLIPFFAAFLLWDKRNEFLRTRIQPSWSGIVLVALGLFELLLGRLGADLFLQRTSFIVLIAGIIWSLLGAPMLRRTKFVLFVLLLAIPLPTIVLNQITFPLQLLASRFASELLDLVHVPVLRDGNIIQLPAMPLEVAEACSGIRSLMSLFTVAVIYGYFLERATWRRVVLALSALPIAVTANVARIFGTGLCVQYWDPVKAMGFFHEFSGWLMFLVSLGCLYLVHVAMDLIAGREGGAA
ncbi:MAG TPA: exosortase/archaeosortase family protein [Acidobacteriaceae bacterium]|nr:exosortase/archaeosortase family protein [Acidobacteriaceae bacterium]